MDEQTLMAQTGEQETNENDNEESGVPNNKHPIAHLQVFLQKSEDCDDVEEIDFPIMEGETTIGRGEDCDVVICAHSLSRQHAQILVEEGSHFIQDLASRNKTFRQMTTLRPKVYYELTDGCELTFANVSCQYHYSLPPEGSFDAEATQAYSVDGGEAANNENKEELEAAKKGVEEEDDSDTSTVCDEGGDGGVGGIDGEDAEPTQAYDLHSPMDCDPTIAYDLAGGFEKLEDSGDEDNESTSSSPLLVGAPKHVHTNDDLGTDKVDDESPKKEATKKKVNFATSEPESDKTCTTGKTIQSSSGPPDNEDEQTQLTTEQDDETDAETEEVGGASSKEDGVKPTPVLERVNTEYMETDHPASMGDVDHTLLYNLETDEESGVSDGDKNESVEHPVTPAIEPTVPYRLDVEDSDNTDLEGEPENESSKEVINTASKPAIVETGSAFKQTTDKNTNKEKQIATSASTSDKADGENKGRKVRGSPSTGPEIIVEPPIPYVIDSGRQKEKGSDKTNTSEDQTHLKITLNQKTLSDVSLMDYSEQDRPTLTMAGAGTLILDSYEESCEQTQGERDNVPLAKGTTVLLESYQSTCPNTVPLSEDEHLLKGDATIPLESYTSSGEDDRALDKERSEVVPSSTKGGRREEQVKDEVQTKSETSNDQDATSDDDLMSLIPINKSKQKTIFLSTLGGRGKRGGARKATRGRGRKNTRTQLVETAKPIKTEDTVILGGSGSNAVSSKGSEEQTENKSASDIEQKTTDHLLLNETLDSNDKTTRTKRESARNPHRLPTLDSVISMDVDVTYSPSLTSGNNTQSDTVTQDKGQKGRGGRSSTRRGRGRGGGSRKVKTEQSTDGASQTLTKGESVFPMSVAGVMSGDLLEESPDLPVTATPKDEGASSGEKTQSDECTSTQSASSDGTTSVSSSKSGRGKRGRGRGKRTSTPRRGKSASKTEAPVEPSPRVRRTPTSSSCKASTSDEGDGREKPRVMFTGLIDEMGERTVKELGGEMVDSVYQCTHLVTDKVRRTLKFLCCLSRGCLIVNDNWLGECHQAGCFLPAEPFLIKDKSAERQHNFSLKRSHDCSKLSKVLADYKVYLTPSIKPPCEQMADIIKCSGGDPLDFLSPVPLGERTVIVTCDDDLSMCREAAEAGVPVCSTEFILGGVLKQELDLKSHIMSIPNEESRGGGRKRRAKEPSTIPAAKRRRK